MSGGARDSFAACMHVAPAADAGTRREACIWSGCAGLPAAASQPGCEGLASLHWVRDYQLGSQTCISICQDTGHVRAAIAADNQSDCSIHLHKPKLKLNNIRTPVHTT